MNPAPDALAALRVPADIKRGLRVVAGLVRADYDADQSEDRSRWTKKEAREVLAAIEWIERISA